MGGIIKGYSDEDKRELLAVAQRAQERWRAGGPRPPLWARRTLERSERTMGGKGKAGYFAGIMKTRHGNLVKTSWSYDRDWFASAFSATNVQGPFTTEAQAQDAALKLGHYTGGGRSSSQGAAQCAEPGCSRKTFVGTRCKKHRSDSHRSAEGNELRAIRKEIRERRAGRSASGASHSGGSGWYAVDDGGELAAFITNASSKSAAASKVGMDGWDQVWGPFPSPEEAKSHMRKKFGYRSFYKD